MTPEVTSISPHGPFLLYLLETTVVRGDDPVRFDTFGSLTEVAQSERDAIYALGRIREACAQRVRRLGNGEQRAFLLSLVALASAESGEAGVPRWPTSSLSSIAGKVRHQLNQQPRVAA